MVENAGVRVLVKLDVEELQADGCRAWQIGPTVQQQDLGQPPSLALQIPAVGMHHAMQVPEKGTPANSHALPHWPTQLVICLRQGDQMVCQKASFVSLQPLAQILRQPQTVSGRH